LAWLRSNPPANLAVNEFTCLQVSEPDSVGACATPIKKIKRL
jgi:hypothetical protein